MNATYYKDEDILEIRFSNAAIIKEVSQDWNVNLSFDAAGQIVEIVILEAQEIGILPAMMEIRKSTGSPTTPLNREWEAWKLT